MNYFENLKIDRIILHKIFKRDINGIVPPIFNNKCENMEEIERTTIEERVVKVVGSQSKAIEMDLIKTGEGSVYSSVAPLLEGEKSETDFIEASKKVTEKLVEAQNSRRMPGGIVVLLSGTTGVDENLFVGIIKAEEDNGFTVQNDGSNMSLKFISDLLLTKNQKIYKVAIMVKKDKMNNNVKPENIRTFIYDSNNNVAKLDAKATYFYDAFMGCAFQESSEILTKNFYHYTKEFARISKMETGQKMSIYNGLYSYLKYNVKPMISVQEFADMYIGSEEIKDLYFKFMEDKKVPSNSIRKDLKLLSKELKKRKIKFTHSITLEVPEEEFRNYVSITEEGDQTIITMNAKMMSEA